MPLILLGEEAGGRQVGISLPCRVCASRASGVVASIPDGQTEKEACGKRYCDAGGSIFGRDPFTGTWAEQEIVIAPGYYVRLKEAFDQDGSIAIASGGWVVMFLCGMCIGDTAKRDAAALWVTTAILINTRIPEMLKRYALLEQERMEATYAIAVVRTRAEGIKVELQRALDSRLSSCSAIPPVL